MIELPPFLLPLALQVRPEGPGLIELFLRAGPMAKVVFAVLGVLSVVSWTTMIGKFFLFRRAERQNLKFLDVFRRSTRFGEVSKSAEALTDSPLVGLFQAGYVEIDTQVKSFREQGGSEAALYRIKSLQAIERSLRRSLGIELLALSKGTSFLATVAAASPFIGLFGTVWGIMVAFQDIGISGSTSLVAVAPGIAEALINTAAGLVAAIPALMGFNYFTHNVRQLRAQMEDFILDFLNLAERNFT